MLDVTHPAARNMPHTNSQHSSQHASLNVASTTVRNKGKALRNISKVVRTICYACNVIDG
jgi:hypothetical protein